MKKISSRRKRSGRGSALLVSLMVIVGLSLLGLGFVAVSETESAIAKNQQAALQTQAVAEAGAKLVIEWFQDPLWGIANAAMPSNDPTVNLNLAATKTTRNITGYTGVYKPRAVTRLLDKPYRPGNDDRLMGDEDHADLTINLTTDRPTIDRFNNVLLGPNSSDRIGGVVTEIKVFAPPIVGGTDTAGFWSGGQRYGVATIKVTAQEFRDPMNYAGILASHSVRMVVGEIPLPIPAGPVQGDANVSFGGNFSVHWGMETSQLAMTPFTQSHAPSTLPWANAFERPHFEHGYEPGSTIASMTVTSGGNGYTVAPTVTIALPSGGPPPLTQATASATIANGQVTGITITNPGHGYVAVPPPPNGTGSVNWGPAVTLSGGGGGSGAAAVANVAAEVWPVTGAQFDDSNTLQEVLTKAFDDPWFGARSVGDNMYDGATAPNVNPQCFPYVFTEQETNTGTGSYAFQWQDSNVYPLKKKVTFPDIRYAFWKRIAQSGRGYRGLYYFSFDAASGGFKKFGIGTAHPMVYWANTTPTGTGAKLGPGVYFFDTANGVDPQTGGGTLSPAESWNSAAFGGAFQMVGFIYMNASSFGTQGRGTSQITTQVNFPGEPFRDIGYPIWCTSVSSPPGLNCPAANAWSDCNGSPCRSGAGDGVFSWQDLNNNGRFDVVVMQQPINFNSYDPGATSHAPTYVVKTWKSPAQATAEYGAPCTVPAATYDGTNPAPTDCSEPHEPYLNIIYPTAATSQCIVGWEAPGAQSYRPKTVDNNGNAVPCPTPATQDLCTSNAYDVDGAVVPLDVILDGILYNEGQYNAQGNASYYGSLLIRQNVSGTGTADVWFDEKLLKGTWAPAKMPRVMMFSEQTDESTR